MFSYRPESSRDFLIPINDINPDQQCRYSSDEWSARCKLASLYRLVSFYGLDQSIYNHITVRLNDQKFLINPFGILYHEITASSLVTMNFDGEVIEPGTTKFGVNKAGSNIHSTFHAKNKDAICVLHIHHPSIVAVSNMRFGLLPISQEAMIIGDVSYYTYNGIEVDGCADQMINSMNPEHNVLFLRNHGVLVVGKSVQEVFYWIYHLKKACDIQVATLNSAQSSEIVKPDPIAIESVQKLVRTGYDHVNKNSKFSWDFGFLEYEAHMRMFESQGCDTGYPFQDRILVDQMLSLKISSSIKNSAINHEKETRRKLSESGDQLNGSLLLIDVEAEKELLQEIPKSESGREIRLTLKNCVCHSRNSESEAKTEACENCAIHKSITLTRICSWRNMYISGASRFHSKKQNDNIVVVS